ncbi:hypothetical protein ACJX0J_022922, partial [Zea mays]
MKVNLARDKQRCAGYRLVTIYGFAQFLFSLDCLLVFGLAQANVRTAYKQKTGILLRAYFNIENFAFIHQKKLNGAMIHVVNTFYGNCLYISQEVQIRFQYLLK